MPTPASPASPFSNAPGAPTPLDRLIDTVDTLLSPGGCPWDREQTHATLAKYLLEETYEALEAIDADDADAMREELGDVLYQVLFHARLAASEGRFDIQDVAADADAKMRGRHPHVFGDAHAETAADVEAVWDAAKAREKSDRTSVLDGIPRALPALSLASKVLGRAAKLGLIEADNPGPFTFDSEQQAGQMLLAVAQAARAQGFDPEAALRGTVHELAGEIRAAESAAGDAGVIGHTPA